MKLSNPSVVVDVFKPSFELQADQFILKKEVLRFSGWSVATLGRRVKAGDFPAPIRLQGSSDNSPSVWSLREVIAWQKVQRNVLSKSTTSNSVTELLKQFSILGSKEKDLIIAVFSASVGNNLGDLKKVKQAVINYLADAERGAR